MNAEGIGPFEAFGTGTRVKKAWKDSKWAKVAANKYTGDFKLSSLLKGLDLASLKGHESADVHKTDNGVPFDPVLFRIVALMSFLNFKEVTFDALVLVDPPEGDQMEKFKGVTDQLNNRLKEGFAAPHRDALFPLKESNLKCCTYTESCDSNVEILGAAPDGYVLVSAYNLPENKYVLVVDRKNPQKTRFRVSTNEIICMPRDIKIGPLIEHMRSTLLTTMTNRINNLRNDTERFIGVLESKTTIDPEWLDTRAKQRGDDNLIQGLHYAEYTHTHRDLIEERRTVNKSGRMTHNHLMISIALDDFVVAHQILQPSVAPDLFHSLYGMWEQLMKDYIELISLENLDLAQNGLNGFKELPAHHGFTPVTTHDKKTTFCDPDGIVVINPMFEVDEHGVVKSAGSAETNYIFHMPQFFMFLYCVRNLFAHGGIRRNIIDDGPSFENMANFYLKSAAAYRAELSKSIKKKGIDLNAIVKDITEQANNAYRRTVHRGFYVTNETVAKVKKTLRECVERTWPGKTNSESADLTENQLEKEIYRENCISKAVAGLDGDIKKALGRILSVIKTEFSTGWDDPNPIGEQYDLESDQLVRELPLPFDDDDPSDIDTPEEYVTKTLTASTLPWLVDHAVKDATRTIEDMMVDMIEEYFTLADPEKKDNAYLKCKLTSLTTDTIKGKESLEGKLKAAVVNLQPPQLCDETCDEKWAAFWKLVSPSARVFHDWWLESEKEADPSPLQTQFERECQKTDNTTKNRALLSKYVYSPIPPSSWSMDRRWRLERTDRLMRKILCCDAMGDRTAFAGRYRTDIAQSMGAEELMAIHTFTLRGLVEFVELLPKKVKAARAATPAAPTPAAPTPVATTPVAPISEELLDQVQQGIANL